jgi:hypothetical protein
MSDRFDSGRGRWWSCTTVPVVGIVPYRLRGVAFFAGVAFVAFTGSGVGASGSGVGSTIAAVADFIRRAWKPRSAPPFTN